MATHTLSIDFLKDLFILYNKNPNFLINKSSLKFKQFKHEINELNKQNPNIIGILSEQLRKPLYLENRGNETEAREFKTSRLPSKDKNLYFNFILESLRDGFINKNLIELLNDTSKCIIKKYLPKVLASFLNMTQKEREQIQIAILEFGVDDFGILRGIKIFGENSKEEFIKLIMQILENELLIFDTTTLYARKLSEDELKLIHINIQNIEQIPNQTKEECEQTITLLNEYENFSHYEPPEEEPNSPYDDYVNDPNLRKKIIYYINSIKGNKELHNKLTQKIFGLYGYNNYVVKTPIDPKKIKGGYIYYWYNMQLNIIFYIIIIISIYKNKLLIFGLLLLYKNKYLPVEIIKDDTNDIYDNIVNYKVWENQQIKEVRQKYFENSNSLHCCSILLEQKFHDKSDWPYPCNIVLISILVNLKINFKGCIFIYLDDDTQQWMSSKRTKGKQGPSTITHPVYAHNLMPQSKPKIKSKKIKLKSTKEPKIKPKSKSNIGITINITNNYYIDINIIIICVGIILVKQFNLI